MSRFLFFIPNRNFYLVVGLVAALVLVFALAVPALAQEVTDPAPIDITTPTAEPPLETPDTTPVIPPDVVPVDVAAAGLIALILNFLVPFGSSPLTTTLVSILKLFIPTNVSATLIKNVVAGVLTIGYWLAVHYNFTDAFASVGQFLQTVLPAIFLLYKNFVDSSRIHDEAAKAKTPLLGYKRT